MSFVNFIRIISPDGETWENYSRRKWGVGVTRWHGFLNGKVDKAWFKILSRPDATLRWRSLLNKGWRETTRRNPSTITYKDRANGSREYLFWVEDNIYKLTISPTTYNNCCFRVDLSLGAGEYTKGSGKSPMIVLREAKRRVMHHAAATKTPTSKYLIPAIDAKRQRVFDRYARRNPDNWTKIGEYWIDDCGKAMFADGDIGDMNHEGYVIDGLAQRLLNAMDIDVSEQAGSLDNWRKNITAVMKEEEFEGDEDEFIKTTASRLWKDEKQCNAAIACAWGQGDARKYGMQYDGWIRVAGHGFECWEMTANVLKRMGDGIYDAGYEDVADDEIFEIYVHKTQMHYTDVPWVVISEGDPGKLRIYGTKNNPRVNLKKAVKVPARLLARGTRVEMEHTRSKRAARIIASHHIAEDPRYYAKLAVMERNPPRVLSYAEAHRWEPLAKARGVSAVARSERGFMRMYQRAGTWDNVNDYWRKRRAAFIARHMAQGRHEALWKKDRSGKLQPSRRCLALIMWAYRPG